MVSRKRREEQDGMSRVGWASRLPYFASREYMRTPFAIRTPVVIRRVPRGNAQHGRRDAHPTQGTPFGFLTRFVNRER